MSQLKKNLFFQTTYQILIIILPLVTAPYVSRVLGPKGVGIYSYTYSVANYFVLFAMLGINNYGNRVIAKYRDNVENRNIKFSNLFYLHAIISLLALGVYILYYLSARPTQKIYILIQGIYVIGALFDINWFYFGMEEFKVTVTRNIIVKCSTVLLIFLFVKNRQDLWKYILIMSAGTTIGQSLVWFRLKRYVKFVHPDWNEIKQNIKPMLILFIPTIAISLYKVMDKIMLGNLSVTAQVGFYENSEKIINIPMSFINGVGAVMLPKMSNLIAKGEKNDVAFYMKNSIQFIMFGSIALAFGVAAVAQEFAPVYFGKEFIECSELMIGLSVTIPFMAFANVIRTQYLIPTEKDKIYVISVISGAFVNVVMNLFLIPRYDAMGAVIGTICAEITVCIIQAVAVCRKIPILEYIKSFYLFPVFGYIMYYCVRQVGIRGGNKVTTILIEMITGVVIYMSLGAAFFITKKVQRKNRDKSDSIL